jgi:hypothetical protein
VLCCRAPLVSHSPSPSFQTISAEPPTRPHSQLSYRSFTSASFPDAAMTQPCCTTLRHSHDPLDWGTNDNMAHHAHAIPPHLLVCPQGQSPRQGTSEEIASVNYQRFSIYRYTVCNTVQVIHYVACRTSVGRCTEKNTITQTQKLPCPDALRNKSAGTQDEVHAALRVDNVTYLPDA